MMTTTTAITVSLPNGEEVYTELHVARMVWAAWYVVAAWAIDHGRGVAIGLDEYGDYYVETVYSHLWEHVRYGIDAVTGELRSYGEQSAPDLREAIHARLAGPFPI